MLGALATGQSNGVIYDGTFRIPHISSDLGELEAKCISPNLQAGVRLDVSQVTSACSGPVRTRHKSWVELLRLSILWSLLHMEV